MSTNNHVRRASDPWLGGRPPHIPFGPGLLPAVCLLPGDPARVDLAGSVLEEFSVVGQNREFRLGLGKYSGVPIAVCSTGIGGPSTEIAVVELSRLGVQHFIRVGGMGALRPEITPGQITVVSQALRGGGAAHFYRPDNEPLIISASAKNALLRAAEKLGEPLTAITVQSCDAYYVGQGRHLSGLEKLADTRFHAVIASGAQAMDMEAETVYAVADALGCSYGALLATHGNRATDEWLEDYEPVQERLLHIAAEAARILVQEI